MLTFNTNPGLWGVSTPSWRSTASAAPTTRWCTARWRSARWRSRWCSAPPWTCSASPRRRRGGGAARAGDRRARRRRDGGVAIALAAARRGAGAAHVRAAALDELGEQPAAVAMVQLELAIGVLAAAAMVGWRSRSPPPAVALARPTCAPPPWTSSASNPPPWRWCSSSSASNPPPATRCAGPRRAPSEAIDHELGAAAVVVHGSHPDRGPRGRASDVSGAMR